MPHTENGKRFRISAKDARRECTEAELGYMPPDSSKKEIEDIRVNTGMFLGLGQKRFMSALKLGAHIEGDAHNIFVEGLSGGSGLLLLKTYLEGILKRDGIEKPDPNDFVYVYNFKAQHKPLSIRLKKGTAIEFKNKLRELLEYLRKHISAAFARRAYQAKMNAAQSEIEDWILSEEKKIKDAALKMGFRLEGSMMETGGQYTPFVRKDPAKDKTSAPGKNAEDEYEKVVLNKLSKKQKTNLNTIEGVIHKFYEESLVLKTKMQIRTFEENKKTAGVVIDGIFDNFFTKSEEYRPDSALMEFLNGLRAYVKNTFPMFLQSVESDPEQLQKRAQMFLPFEVNVYVDNSDVTDVPIIAENITKLSDFVGGTDYVISQGVAYTDHMKIHPGLLARANGGYLVINADKFLVIPGLFEAFMNALESKKVFAEQSRGLFASSHLEPMPISLNVRVIIFGEITRLLHQFPGFSRLFSTHAHIEPFVERTPLQIAGYRAWIEGVVVKEKLKTIAPNAVCNLIEHAGRLAGDRSHLSTDFESLAHVLREAGVIAEQLKAPSIASKHIRKALQERFWRSSFSYEYLQGMVRRGEILIDAKGASVGQNNALAVHYISKNIAVGFPTRVTGTASVGKPGLSNVHVLSKMAGKLTQKADQTVEGFLRHKFAREAPLSLGVTLSFEQTYGMIDGDSASLVSLFVALSSISQVPLKQVGITGSMNLHGKVQPIGGVNEKIEGYFDTCCALGCMDGSQGVIIPWQNKENLMLRFDVIVAIRMGKFNVWPIKTIEEGIEILTGMEAGTPNESGVYPENTFYKCVADQIKKFRENAVKFSKESETSES